MIGADRDTFVASLAVILAQQADENIFVDFRM
jgi:hypothetical protein